MCKVVYLTSRRFDWHSNIFKKSLSAELKARNIEVVSGCAYDFFNQFRKHKTYGISIALDFYRDDKHGCGLTLNRQSSHISREFAYNLSNALDVLTPNIQWRDFNFVDSYDKQWFRFFNKVSSSTKAIFYLCTSTNHQDWENYSIMFDEIIKAFADEIEICLRSNYNTLEYRERVKTAKIKRKK